MIGWLKQIRNRSLVRAKFVWWDMEAERLMALCRDTGGESSPYFDKLREHFNNVPTEKERQ